MSLKQARQLKLLCHLREREADRGLGLQEKKDNHRKMEKSKCLVNKYLLDHAETMSDRKFLVSRACQGASTTPSPDSV